MTGITFDGFYNLTPQADDFELTPGLLAEAPLGLRALDGDDTVVGSLDAEVINGNQGDDELYGDGGDDYLRGGQGSDLVYGEDGDDVLNGNFGSDRVNGGDGDDIVRGGRGDDLLIGGAGMDILIGDMGSDVLAGNEDTDLFVLRTEIALEGEPDIILDFNAFEDVIGLTGGVTEADLILEEVSLPLELVADLIDLGADEAVNVVQQLTGINIDPNGTRTIDATLINQGEKVLAVALNTYATDLQGSFMAIDDFTVG